MNKLFDTISEILFFSFLIVFFDFACNGPSNAYIPKYVRSYTESPREK